MSEEIDDGGPYFRVYAFGVGRVLTEADVADIQKVLADYNEELASQADLYDQARTAGLHALGGDDLVKAVHAKDEATTKAIIDKALGSLMSNCGGNEHMCEHARSDGGCYAEARGKYCPWIVAETLRAVGKCARAAQQAGIQKERGL